MSKVTAFNICFLAVHALRFPISLDAYKILWASLFVGNASAHCASKGAVMKKTVFLSVLKAAVPLVLGFAGGVVGTFWPAYHAAFCNGSLSGLASCLT